MNAAVAACRRSARWEVASALLFDMRRNAVAVDRFAVNAGIHACERSREWKDALQIVLDMGRNQIQPDSISYASAIGVCEKASRAHHASSTKPSECQT